jgi:hypothetical protein
LSTLGGLPFLWMYVLHFNVADPLPTGFVFDDMAQYVAFGRAAFEQGNGLTYRNVYDPDPAAPAVYFHWVPWLLGFAVVQLHLDPGYAFVALGIVAALATSRVTLALVDLCLPDGRYRGPLFLLTMWGGGLFAALAFIENIVIGRPHFDSLLGFEPAEGWWLLNWGRNLVFATEATYHFLIAAAWLGVLRNRWWLTVMAAALVAAAHPYSGAQALAILLAWCVLHRMLPRVPPVPVWALLWLLGVTAAFVAYNLVFLPSFPHHRAVMERMSQPWHLGAFATVLAHAPVVVLAAARAALDRRQLGGEFWFLAVCASTSFLLANHHWIMRPVEPIHFVRGYIWLPLWLVGLPVLQRTLVWSWATTRRTFATAMPLLALALVSVFDNFAFLAQYPARREQVGVYLSPAQRDIVSQINAKRLRGVMLCPDLDLSYVLPTYTQVHPYCGYTLYTPDYIGNATRAVWWSESGEGGPWMSVIDLALLPRHASDVARRDGWQLVAENDEWLVFARPGSNHANSALIGSPK